MTRGLCDELIDRVIDTGRADAAQDYAQRIPVRVISWMLGVPDELADTFTGWVRDVLEYGARPRAQRAGVERDRRVLHDGRRGTPRTTSATTSSATCCSAEVDGEPVPDEQVLGTLALILVAGVDTTWSSIGSAMWHLATHDDDRRRLVAEPELIPTAIEELLRAYSPVTMARVATEDTDARRLPGPRRRQGAAELRGRQPRPGGVRAGGRGRHRSSDQPPRRVRRRASTAAPARTWPGWSCRSPSSSGCSASPSSASSRAPR